MADATPLVEVRGLCVRFPGESRDAIRDVSLALASGERIAIVGPSGCGKSTFALALAGAIPSLVPATIRGDIAWATTGEGSRTAFVQQDVESQLVALSVEGEIAFALENRGAAPARIDEAVATALREGPGQGLQARDDTLSLSTGWRQRLALAAALAERAALTILDEPTAHLDEAAAQDAIAFVCTGASGSLVLVEHRVDLVAPGVDRILVLDRMGDPLALAEPRATLDTIAARPDLGLRLPAAHGAFRDARAPLPSARADGPAVLTLDAVGLKRGGRSVLADVSLELAAGEVAGLAGGNGAGKTSLCLVAAGALRPNEGRRHAARRVAARMVPQNPSLVFASASLALEARRRGLAWPDAAQALDRFGIAPDPQRHPLNHSRGELRRIALAFALAGTRPILAILDEPTAGLDAHGLAALEARLAACRAAGSAVLVVSHDTGWLARTCDRIHVVEAGRLVAPGKAEPR